MTGHDLEPTRSAPGNHRDPVSSLDRLVRQVLGRRVPDLCVVIRGGGFVLRGRATSYHAKQLAQHAAMAATNLPLTANEIEVADFRHGASRPDETAARRPAEPLKPFVVLATGDDRLRSAARHYLADHGYTVATATDGLECVAVLHELTAGVALIVLDANLLWGGADGVLEYLRGRDTKRVPVVLLGAPPNGPVGHDTPATSPVVAVLERPVGLSSLLAVVQAAAGGRA
ncbi:MAG: response regulator transcription factor [Planctomycetes bacterium]|nr:response regulator transcription factor [Planctomycetota bacterium]